MPNKRLKKDYLFSRAWRKQVCHKSITVILKMAHPFPLRVLFNEAEMEKKFGKKNLRRFESLQKPLE